MRASCNLETEREAGGLEKQAASGAGELASISEGWQQAQGLASRINHGLRSPGVFQRRLGHKALPRQAAARSEAWSGWALPTLPPERSPRTSNPPTSPTRDSPSPSLQEAGLNRRALGHSRCTEAPGASPGPAPPPLTPRSTTKEERRSRLNPEVIGARSLEQKL